MHKKYWVALSSIEQLDSKFIIALYDKFGNIKTAFNSTLADLTRIEGLSKKKAEYFLEHRDKLDIDKVYNYVTDRGINILTYEDDSYPYMLKQIADPPAVLYYKGDLSCCNLEKTVAVVGSRKMSRNAQDALKKIMSGLANTDLCIVSGLASGVDGLAHKLALENRLKTIGVIGSGLNFIYPSSNKTLYDEILKGNGCIMSEYYPTFEPIAFRFPQRNRIVSGLSYGTLVVEATLKSGALITANLTLDQGRELMCIPGLITSPNTEGIYKMIKTGAHIITESEDILNALNWTVNRQIPLFDNTSQNPDNLSEAEQKIITALEIEPKSFDEIQKETNITTDELLMNLTTLELNGFIEQTQGDRYKKL